MVWKAPEPHELDAPKEMKDIMLKSVYYNTQGYLDGASQLLKIEYTVVLLLTWSILSAIITFLLKLISNTSVIISVISFIVNMGNLLLLVYLYRKYGWNNYHEKWYHFDENDEMFIVIQKDKNDEWEMFEIPYEDIHDIEWYDGPNGKAIIKAADFEFHTNRSLEKRASSVTELWHDLARINTRMSDWPIYLDCPVCKRTFGNHTGTATCPFDEDVLLLDPNIKGRIDPEGQHKDDIDRI